MRVLLALILAVSAADRQEADRLYQQARSDFATGAYRMALTEASRAHDLDPKPMYLLEVADCQRLLGQWADAAATYRSYLALPQAHNRPAIRKALAEAQSHLSNGASGAAGGADLAIAPLVATPLVPTPPPPEAAPPPVRVPVTAVEPPPPPAAEIAGSSDGPTHAWGYTLVGVAVAAAAVGVVGWINVASYNSYASSVTNGQITSTGLTARQNLSSAQTWQIVAISTTIATGLAGGGAALVW